MLKYRNSKSRFLRKIYFLDSVEEENFYFLGYTVKKKEKKTQSNSLVKYSQDNNMLAFLVVSENINHICVKLTKKMSIFLFLIFF